MSSYPVPIYLPRRRRIVTPAEWLREKVEERRREREATISRAIAFGAALATPVTNTASITTSSSAPSGSRIFMGLGWNDPTNNLNATFSSGGLSWVVDKQYRAAYQQCCAICSADAPSGLGSSVAITPSFDGGIDFGPGISIFYATGIEGGTSGYLDGTPPAAIDNFNEDWFTEDLVTGAAESFLVGLSQVEPSSGNTATSPTVEVDDWLIEGTNRATTCYRIVGPAGTYRLEGLWAGAVSYSQAIGVAYKAAAEGEAEPEPVARRFPLFSGFRG